MDKQERQTKTIVSMPCLDSPNKILRVEDMDIATLISKEQDDDFQCVFCFWI
jgi:hypothetical protein